MPIDRDIELYYSICTLLRVDEPRKRRIVIYRTHEGLVKRLWAMRLRRWIMGATSSSANLPVATLGLCLLGSMAAMPAPVIIAVCGILALGFSGMLMSKS